jgi:hypothetical protein
MSNNAWNYTSISPYVFKVLCLGLIPVIKKWLLDRFEPESSGNFDSLMGIEDLRGFHQFLEENIGIV